MWGSNTIVTHVAVAIATTVRFWGIYFQSSSKIHKSNEICSPQKFPAIQYIRSSCIKHEVKVYDLYIVIETTVVSSILFTAFL